MFTMPKIYMLLIPLLNMVIFEEATFDTFEYKVKDLSPKELFVYIGACF